MYISKNVTTGLILGFKEGFKVKRTCGIILIFKKKILLEKYNTIVCEITMQGFSNSVDPQ